MSHILQRLRQQLDDPLLVKTPSGMKPTEHALDLVDPVKAVLQDIERLIALTVPHFLLAPLIVANTDLILALPGRIAEQFARMAPLQIVPLPFELPRYASVMVWHPLREKEPAQIWLREQIRQVCRDLTASGFAPSPSGRGQG